MFPHKVTNIDNYPNYTCVKIGMARSRGISLLIKLSWTLCSSTCSGGVLGKSVSAMVRNFGYVCSDTKMGGMTNKDRDSRASITKIVIDE